jgi:hypothetical protein
MQIGMVFTLRLSPPYLILKIFMVFINFAIMLKRNKGHKEASPCHSSTPRNAGIF